MYYDIVFEYQGKTYKREVCRGMRGIFIMKSTKEKGVDFHFDRKGDKTINYGWVQTNGPEIAAELFLLIAEQLEKIPYEVQHKRIPKHQQRR